MCVVSFRGAYSMVGPMRTDVITAPSLGPPRPREQAQFVGTN